MAEDKKTLEDLKEVTAEAVIAAVSADEAVLSEASEDCAQL